MERVKGIEPSSQAWEARILPLNHTRADTDNRFSTRQPDGLQAPFDPFEILCHGRETPNPKLPRAAVAHVRLHRWTL